MYTREQNKYNLSTRTRIVFNLLVKRTAMKNNSLFFIYTDHRTAVTHLINFHWNNVKT